jgi:hypothetical protein
MKVNCEEIRRLLASEDRSGLAAAMRSVLDAL